MDNADRAIGFRLYTLWVSDDAMREIKHYAVDDGVSVAYIVRKLLDDYVQIRNKGRT